MKREAGTAVRLMAIVGQPSLDLGIGGASRDPDRVGVIGSLLIALIAAAGSVSADGGVAIDSLVLQELDTAGRADFFVVLEAEADLVPAAGLASKEAKGRFVLTALRRDRRGLAARAAPAAR